MDEPQPQRQATPRDIAVMLAAMAAAVFFLIGWNNLEPRVIGLFSDRALGHYILLAGGVLLSVVVYTAITRAFNRRPRP